MIATIEIGAHHHIQGDLVWRWLDAKSGKYMARIRCDGRVWTGRLVI
jgi:hypothetical protein